MSHHSTAQHIMNKTRKLRLPRETPRLIGTHFHQSSQRDSDERHVVSSPVAAHCLVLLGGVALGQINPAHTAHRVLVSDHTPQSPTPSACLQRNRGR